MANVLLFCGIGIALLGMLSLFDSQIYGYSLVARTQHRLEFLGATLEVYQWDMGRFPLTDEGLNALSDRSRSLGNWHGPFLSSLDFLDGWCNPLDYTSNGDIFQIRSAGPDGRFGTGDDLCYSKRESSFRGSIESWSSADSAHRKDAMPHLGP